jgi:hypothetical protein
MKLNLPNRQRALVIGAGAMVALYILDAVLFSPLTKMWQAHAAEIVKLRGDIARGRSLIARAAQTDRVWAEMQANALPKDAAQGEQDVLTAVSRWGAANNVTLDGLRQQWKRGANERYSLFECRVDATGNINTLSRFLWELERSPLALRVDSVELTSRDDYGQKLTLGLIISGLRLSPLERNKL